MNMNAQDALLIEQLRRKQELKQQCLHEDEESPLHKEAEKILTITKLIDEDSEPIAFVSLIKKEQKFVESVIEEMQAAYKEMPDSMKDSAYGKHAKQSLMLTTGALHRLKDAEGAAEPKQMFAYLEEASFLLEGADGRA
jgi:hypothetical protein